ncbi:MAG: glycine cleavage system protein H [Candidatus Marinimicrobia bacterium]|nr:glycine cleavage system protein H [Candidatus Neomarinimicrobiota bacterium]|tara:strand:+ start:353 stop:727 length:375 start_codon:yes stop_codon:yes gene_type:complete
MNTPDNLKYTKEHEWCKIDDNIAVVGITDFAQGELGDIVFVEFPNLNDEIKQNDTVGTIEAVKTVADLYSPLSGTIIEINESLESEPNLINDSPYDNGWIFKIKINSKDELNNLLDSNSYKKII